MIVLCKICYDGMHENNAAYAFLNPESHCCSVSYVCQKCFKKHYENDGSDGYV